MSLGYAVISSISGGIQRPATAQTQGIPGDSPKLLSSVHPWYRGPPVSPPRPVPRPIRFTKVPLSWISAAMAAFDVQVSSLRLLTLSSMS